MRRVATRKSSGARDNSPRAAFMWRDLPELSLAVMLSVWGMVMWFAMM